MIMLIISRITIAECRGWGQSASCWALLRWGQEIDTSIVNVGEKHVWKSRCQCFAHWESSHRYSNKHIYIYIYIHTYRKRERETYMYNYVYIYIYIHMYMYMFVWMKLEVGTSPDSRVRGSRVDPVRVERAHGYSAEGGAVGGGVQWIGVVLCSKIVYNIISIPTPCFHCTPLCGI